MNDLILVGIQGSGKGTQAKLLAQKFGFQIFETGGALRAMAQEDSELGRRVKAITEQGDLVPNEIVMEIVEQFLDSMDPETPVIFDGIPRSGVQRESLEKLLEINGREFIALEIRLSEKAAMKRMMKRAEIEGRADDTPEVMKKRIHNFHTHTAPLLEVWEKNGKLLSINGEQRVEDVTKEIFEKLEDR